MSQCGCHNQAIDARGQRRSIATALVLNAVMFGVGTAAGVIADSTALLADALDMLADALAYGVSLFAIGRSDLVKRRAALSSGCVLGVLGLGVMIEAVRRTISGTTPAGAVMLGTAILSLIVNTTVLRMLSRYRDGEVHLRASWIFTRADIVANAGVILAAIFVMTLRSRVPDLVLGLVIGAYVVKEAFEIGRNASESPRL